MMTGYFNKTNFLSCFALFFSYFNLKKRILGRLTAIVILVASSFAHAGNDAVWYDKETNLTWMRCAIGQKWAGGTCRDKPLGLQWKHALHFVTDLNRDGGFVGHRDWRVPTIKELSKLRKCSNGWEMDQEVISRKTTTTVEGVKSNIILGKERIKTITLAKGMSLPKSCVSGSKSPTIDTAIFPNTTPECWYWSSTSVAKNNDSAWFISFSDGQLINNEKSFDCYIRLVRSGQ